jgi:choline dehydrogenase-like flavoprotein
MATGYGVPLVLDRNDPNTPFNSVDRVPVEQRADTTRSHSSREYLTEGVDVIRHKEHYDEGINGRDLLVLYGSTVTNIYWEKNSKSKKCNSANGAVAEAIEFVRFGVSYRVNIGTKLVLASGLNSAPLLMVNGIGPVDQLTDAGIPIVFANPNVGQNIQNHTNIAMSFSHPATDQFLTDPNSIFSAGASVPYGVVGATATATATIAGGAVTGITINNAGSGYTVAPVVTISGGGGTGAIFTANLTGGTISSFTQTAPGTGYTSVPTVSIASPPAGTAISGQPREFNVNVTATAGGSPTISGYTIAPMYPRSIGYVKIFKEDPLAPILVDLQYLVDPADVADAIRFIRKAVSIIQSAGYTVTVPSAIQLATDATLETFIRGALGQNHHYSGSCRMARDASTGVIDPYGNVFGTENIVIIDASGFPSTVDANLAGLVYPYSLKLFQDLERDANPYRLYLKKRSKKSGNKKSGSKCKSKC